MTLYDFHRGTVPLLISIPHAGTFVPPELLQRFSPVACELPDTDWYVDRLYGFASAMGASIIKANLSRYVVDLNRAPDSAALYAANPTSPVCPTMTFAGDAIYEHSDVPDDREIRERVDDYWRPYHRCIGQELARIKDARCRCGTRIPLPARFRPGPPECCRNSTLLLGDGANCPRAASDALLYIVLGDGEFAAFSTDAGRAATSPITTVSLRRNWLCL